MPSACLSCFRRNCSYLHCCFMLGKCVHFAANPCQLNHTTAMLLICIIICKNSKSIPHPTQPTHTLAHAAIAA